MENMNTDVRVERVKDQIINPINTSLVERYTSLFVFFLPCLSKVKSLYSSLCP